MNRCGTCKHFGEPYELDTYDDRDKTVTRVLHTCDWLQHLNGRGGDAAAALLKAAKAGPIDGSGYHAAFCVSEEFGCTEWARRE